MLLWVCKELPESKTKFMYTNNHREREAIEAKKPGKTKEMSRYEWCGQYKAILATGSLRSIGGYVCCVWSTPDASFWSYLLFFALEWPKMA